MAILEERGLFWWDTGKLEENVIAPDPHVAGVLKIDDDGRPTLELDGYLPNKHGPMGAIEQGPLQSDQRIHGVLKGPNRQVLLCDLSRNGGRFGTDSISYDCFSARFCLVSEASPLRSRKLTFDRIDIGLDGLEEWLRLGAMKISRGQKVVSVKYKQPSKVRYALPDGSLTVQFYLDGKFGGRLFSAEASMKEVASVSLRYKNSQDLDAVQTQHLLLQDLFLLLTGAPILLPWPAVYSGKGESHRVYFMRMSSDKKQAKPRHFECITNYVELRDRFGSVWSQWKKIRETLGPGVYLYLGTRRGLKQYIENRFVNLVFGLEALHRKTGSPAAVAGLKAKIDRILRQVSRAKDRRWLENFLQRVQEPALEQRLFQTLSNVPLDLEDARLRKFCADCAKLRNDISHFGGDRHVGRVYNDFIRGVHDRAEVLSTLYHLLLLKEIGIDNQILKRWVFDGFESFGIKYHLVQVGLLDQSAIKPEKG